MKNLLLGARKYDLKTAFPGLLGSSSKQRTMILSQGACYQNDLGTFPKDNHHHQQQKGLGSIPKDSIKMIHPRTGIKKTDSMKN